jgi:hypothetical protein
MPRFLQLAIYLLFLSSPALVVAQQLPLLVEDSFENGVSLWQMSDPAAAKPTWEVIASDKDPATHVLRAKGGSKYEPPHRSPWNMAFLKDTVVGDFELIVRVQNTNYDAGDHRDQCIFWGYQDPAHFYYVHLGAKPDPHSCQIFIVNDADRKMITDKKSTGTPWDRDWHTVRVRRNVETGSMEVFFDDMKTPVMTANDKTFTWGRVGIGTFDDNGNFDEFQLRGVKVDPIPAQAKLPGND